MPEQGRSPTRTTLAEVAESVENLDEPVVPNFIEEPPIEIEPLREPENLNNDDEFQWVQEAIQNNQVEQVRNDFRRIAEAAEDARFLLDVLDEVAELPEANQVIRDIGQEDMELLPRNDRIANDEGESASFNDWMNEPFELPDRENPMGYAEMRHAANPPNILNNYSEHTQCRRELDTGLDALDPLDLALRALSIPITDMKAEGYTPMVFSEHLTPMEMPGLSNEACGFRDYDFEKPRLIDLPWTSRSSRGAQAVNPNNIKCKQTSAEEKVCRKVKSIGDEESKDAFKGNEKSCTYKSARIAQGSTENCKNSDAQLKHKKVGRSLEHSGKSAKMFETCEKSESSPESDEKSEEAFENREKSSVSPECNEKSEDTHKNVEESEDLFENRK